MSTAHDISALEFLRGQEDCQRGEPHKAGRSESYDRGYAAQYEWEQVKGEISDRCNRIDK